MLYVTTCAIWKKKNEYKKTETDSQIELAVKWGRGMEGGAR